MNGRSLDSLLMLRKDGDTGMGERSKKKQKAERPTV